MTRLVAGWAVVVGLALSSCHPPDITTGDTPVVGARAIDGDTFKLSERRYRLAWIDAPELPGHCRPNRACAPGDPFAAKRQLQWFLDAGIRCRAIGLDYYRRTLVECHLGKQDIGEQLIALGYAQEYRRGR